MASDTITGQNSAEEDFLFILAPASHPTKTLPRLLADNEGIPLFKQSVTLQTVFRQAGQDPEQVAFRDALLRQRTYTITQEDFELLSKQFWTNISIEEKTLFADALHLLPAKVMISEYNLHALAMLGNPVVCIKVKHNCTEAKKASEEDADGLEKQVLLAEGACCQETPPDFRPEPFRLELSLASTTLKE
ncbi:hypothetical protein M422DRAFT_262361 [Sphaerobolus stellatus SS14]|uniref:Uncharacterized protein n=1 Tax=Sphaerobolus stellatus (strain SS14) TaxID=990650 RepID=A0A0C9UKN9_SPHS4|nr:hypothetical protein M422DRAFT_262361 [Sphaerobolus stellatus SS14]